MRASTPDVAAWLGKLDGENRAAVGVLRGVIFDAAPDIHELVYHDALGYSTTDSAFDRMLYVAVSGRHLNFGFFFGSSLDDPAHLLRGEGKRMRHVRIAGEDDAQNRSIHQLIRQALEDGPENVRRLHERRRSS
jgi:hypothetical protein